MDKLWVAIAALIGGLASAGLGWLESKEPFDPRKFGGSAIRSLVAALIFVAGYSFSNSIGILDLFYAFLGGAGVDVIGNRIAGRAGNGSFPLPSGESQIKAKTPEQDTAKKDS
jgi:hypothetical protein